MFGANMTQTITAAPAVQQLTAAYQDLANKLKKSELVFTEAVKNGDIPTATLAHEKLSCALRVFREAEKAAMVKLPSGSRIYVTDYLGLKKVAEDNGIELTTVLAGIKQIGAGGRVENIELNNKGIANISGLANLTSLTELRLTDNQITNIAPLAKLTALTVLSLIKNRISKSDPIIEALKASGCSVLI